MHKYVIDISTDVYHLLQQQGPGSIALAEEKPGPTQKILLGDDGYIALIDRAIARRQTLDQVVREAYTKLPSPAASMTK